MEGKELRRCETSAPLLLPPIRDSLIIHGENMPYNEGHRCQRLGVPVCKPPCPASPRHDALSRLSPIVSLGREHKHSSRPRVSVATRARHMEATASVINFWDVAATGWWRSSHPVSRTLRH
ncbi:hypothetical protein E2C01_004714 [Portunus trituberculatus]|uniref:Uncharacterized protein n=1 Tax=Portunus trituberculatus TaxID=210409 RepID=A0A5B7CQD9_PORTR|nr:hypothetical protein [Portunus trituberculatus]